MAEEKRELLEKINRSLQAAMKAREELRLSVLRMIKSKILYVNARGDLADAEIIKIINKYGKDLKEAIVEFEKGGRIAETERLKAEIAIVQEYLPKELSPEEIKAAVEGIITEVGAASNKEMGKIMKEVLARYPGIDGKLVSQIVRERLP